VERWKQIPGYEGYYEASDQGRIRSVDRVVQHPLKGPTKRRGKVLRDQPRGTAGHRGVGLSIEGRTKVLGVHRLVLEAWVGPCPDGHEGCHKNGNPADNAVSNLRWGTKSSNQYDKREHGTNGGVPVIRSDDVEFRSMHEAAEQSGCAAQGVWKACNGRRKSAGGYGWKYADDDRQPA